MGVFKYCINTWWKSVCLMQNGINMKFLIPANYRNRCTHTDMYRKILSHGLRFCTKWTFRLGDHFHSLVYFLSDETQSVRYFWCEKSQWFSSHFPQWIFWKTKLWRSLRIGGFRSEQLLYLFGCAFVDKYRTRWIICGWRREGIPLSPASPVSWSCDL